MAPIIPSLGHSQPTDHISENMGELEPSLKPGEPLPHAGGAYHLLSGFNSLAVLPRRSFIVLHVDWLHLGFRPSVSCSMGYFKIRLAAFKLSLFSMARNILAPCSLRPLHLPDHQSHSQQRKMGRDGSSLVLPWKYWPDIPLAHVSKALAFRIFFYRPRLYLSCGCKTNFTRKEVPFPAVLLHCCPSVFPP